MIYSPERENNIRISTTIIFKNFDLFRRLLTLFMPILLHHVQLCWSSSSLPMLSPPLLGTDCLSFPSTGGLGPPLIPLPQADPIFLRSQATPHVHVGNTTFDDLASHYAERTRLTHIDKTHWFPRCRRIKIAWNYVYILK